MLLVAQLSDTFGGAILFVFIVGGAVLVAYLVARFVIYVFLAAHLVAFSFVAHFWWCTFLLWRARLNYGSRHFGGSFV